jgi:hypothetical protein
MANRHITKSAYDSLCDLRGRIDCFSEFTNLISDDVQYASVLKSFSSIIDEALERLENDFSSLHITLKNEEENHV